MKVLIAEDDPFSLQLLEHSLTSWGYEVVSVADGVEAWEVLQGDDAPRLAIIDWMMPGLDGIEVCRRLRKSQKPENGYTYVIILTVKSSLEDMVGGLRSGADDYIIKPFAALDLQARLEAGKRIVELQERLKEVQKAITSQVAHDIPTRTWSRDSIISHVRTELTRSCSNCKSLSIALLHIDNYAELKEKRGDGELEPFLFDIIQQIAKLIRSYDSIGRFADDQFLILFPETTDSDMPNIMDRVLGDIHSPHGAVEPGSGKLAVSVGVATARGATGEELLLTTANEALKSARIKKESRIHFVTIQGAE